MNSNVHFEPLSTTMACVINLTLQYFLIYTALGISRTYCDLTNSPHAMSGVQTTLKHAAETVFYAPMVCLLFLAFRMRVLQLTHGTGNPPDWVRLGMHGVSYAILANTLLVCIIPIFCQGKQIETDPKTGELKEGNPFENSVLRSLFTAVRYCAFLALYVGFGAVICGVFTYEPPAGTWRGGAIPDVSPAVACTVTLGIAFFLVYFLNAVARSYTLFAGGNEHVSHFEEVMARAADTMGMAPMLSALFLACRLRALYLDPVHGNPQRWAQHCFFLCTYSIVIQTCVSVFVPLALGHKASKGRTEGDMQFDAPAGWLAKSLTVLRFAVMICTYLGAFAVVCSAFTIQKEGGNTPPISPTVQCVFNLAAQYFFIYLVLWIVYTIEDLQWGSFPRVADAVQSAKATVQFAPMLCVLFMATRMRALQITQNKGAPQRYVQDGMYLATWALLIQFVMCLAMPLVTGTTYKSDTLDDVAQNKPVGNAVGAITVQVFRYLALIALIGGVATVITGVFLMTPENATGRGSIPLVGDGTLGTDLIPGVPPGPDAIPGARGVMENIGETLGAGAEVATNAGSTVGDAASNAGGAVADGASATADAVGPSF